MTRTRPVVMMTGASGVLGRVLAEELAADFDLVCLVHRTPIRGIRVRSVHGDLSRPDLGLDAGTVQTLARQVDSVVHCGAETKWTSETSDIRETNSAGTARMLDFAHRSGAVFYHVSTAFVARSQCQPGEGQPGEGQPGEGQPGEGQPEEGQSGAAAYVASKIEAERLVQDSGLPAVIIRPSIVTGDSTDGRIAALQGLHRLAVSVLRDAAPVVPAAASTRIDCVPQDVVARFVGQLVRARVAEGTYWLTAGPHALTLGEMVGVTLEIAEQLGLSVHQPRMIPTEAVNRLILPLLEDAIPRTLAGRFGQLIELLRLFQSEFTLPTSLPPDMLSHEMLLTAFRRCVEHAAVRSRLAAPDRFGQEAVA
jgi:thioester reductase-like protein